MSKPATQLFHQNGRRITATVLALLLLLTAQQGWLDRIGLNYTESGFKRALVTFAVARGLNGVISVAQGTEVALQPAGVGVNFTPGQILDPINDLVERFSWVMLAATTSLGLQKLLLNLFASPAFTIVIALTVLVALVLTWSRYRNRNRARTLAYRIAIGLLLVRFTIPLIAITSEALFHTFLEPQYSAATQGIEQTTERISQINHRAESELQPPVDPSLLDRARQLYNRTADALDVGAYLERYEQAAAEASEHAINLIVIFLLQTVILPLLFLWVAIKLVKGVFSLPLGLFEQQKRQQ